MIDSSAVRVLEALQETLESERSIRLLAYPSICLAIAFGLKDGLWADRSALYFQLIITNQRNFTDNIGIYLHSGDSDDYIIAMELSPAYANIWKVLSALLSSVIRWTISWEYLRLEKAQQQK